MVVKPPRYSQFNSWLTCPSPRDSAKQTPRTHDECQQLMFHLPSRWSSPFWTVISFKCSAFLIFMQLTSNSTCKKKETCNNQTGQHKDTMNNIMKFRVLNCMPYHWLLQGFWPSTVLRIYDFPNCILRLHNTTERQKGNLASWQYNRDKTKGRVDEHKTWSMFLSTVTGNIALIVEQDLPPHKHQLGDILCKTISLIRLSNKY